MRLAKSVISGELFSPMLAGAFPTTPGAVTLPDVSTFGYLIKIHASGQNIEASILDYGKGPAALDSAGNIYTAGSLIYTKLPSTASALQPDHVTFGCSGTSYVGTPCSYGYVAKISPDGTKLLYATYLTGDYGSAPAALFIDAAGDAIIAGTTASHNFPPRPARFTPKIVAKTDALSSMDSPALTRHSSRRRAPDSFQKSIPMAQLLFGRPTSEAPV